MKIINEFIKPSDLNERQAEYYTRGLTGGLMAFIYWSLLVVYFVAIKAPQPLIIAGIAAVVSFLLFLFLWYRRKYTIGWIIGYFNLYIVVSFLTLQLGWALGFQFVLLSGVIFSEAGIGSKSRILSYIQVVTVVVFAALGFLTYGLQVEQPIPEGHGIILFMVNLVSPLLGPVLTQRSYLINAAKLEDQLEKSHEENEKLLHNILPIPIAAQLKSSKAKTIKRFENASILFADIVNFTPLAEKIPPQELVDILDGLFSKFDELTDKYDLEKIKTIGDAYMVASGVPVIKANHAITLFHFAQEMIEEANNFSTNKGLTLQLRIGISSGPVVAGVIGKKKFSYDLWGDTVNTAARMESNGRTGKIQVSENTYQLLKGEFTFDKIPNVEIKGKGIIDVFIWNPST